MLFHTFSSQEERRNFGGSAFIEMQFCKLPSTMKIKEMVEVSRIKNWQDDSLYIYIDDVNVFYQVYSNYFNCGIYNNLKSGIVDIYGINYYALALTDSIIKKILDDKPNDYEILIEWLNKSQIYNGFYILGL